MKKFQFKLDTVMDYKQQVLENRLVEHGAAAAQTREQEAVFNAVQVRLTEYEDEYRQKKAAGLNILELQLYQDCLEALHREEMREQERLVQLQQIEEEKRSRVIESRTETATLEKLRDIKHKEYLKELQKDEERFIDDLTAARRYMNA